MKDDLFAREIENKLHSDLQKLENASPHEKALGEIEIAGNLLKDCETASEFIEKIPDNFVKPKKIPEFSDEAEKIHNQIKADFKKSLNENEKYHPNEVRAIRKRYWSVGIQL